MTRARVAATDDIADESTLRVEVDGVAVCLVRSGGELFAVNDVCTHEDVSLAEGDVDDGTVECCMHGSRFDLRTGRPLELPATRPVPVYRVDVEGDDIYVTVGAN